jgi:hypothetical protein
MAAAEDEKYDTMWRRVGNIVVLAIGHEGKRKE